VTQAELVKLSEERRIEMAIHNSLHQNQQTKEEIKEARTKLDQLVARDYKVLLDVPEDGSCQMHALIKTFEDTTGKPCPYPTVDLLRQAMVQFMKQNRPQLVLLASGNLIVEGSTVNEETWASYVDQYGKAAVWGDDTTLQAAASLLKVTVRVYQCSRVVEKTTGYVYEIAPMHGVPENTLSIACHGGRHYYGTMPNLGTPLELARTVVVDRSPLT
jgi:hypothetical protein